MATIKLDGIHYRTAGELPAVGSHAPDMSLVNTRLQDVTLSKWTGMRKIMNIFPSIDTSVCATSVTKFDRIAEGLKDVVVLMISCDLPFAHARFAKEHDLKNVIGLSAIRSAGFGEDYGVQILDGPFAGLFSRAVLVMDENNTVVHQEYVEDISHEPNYAAALRALGVSIDKDLT